MKLPHALILILAIILVTVIVQNSSVAVVHILFWKISMSLIILIFFSALLGFIIGLLFHRMKILHSEKKE